MSKLRLSLTIPGAVSLGSYEGGALAALLVAVRRLGEQRVVIDSISGASAGSITALLTAKVLLRGTDPVELLKGAWVENVSFQAMQTHSTDSLLSSSALTDMAAKLLGPDGPADGDPKTCQQEPIHLSLSLTSLQGLTYQLPSLDRTTIPASTYQDWYDAVLTTADDDARFEQHAEAAIASASNAMAFPAKRLDRSADAETYRAAGLQGFPTDGQFWYTDGGTTNNEPLGRTIDLAQDVTGDEGDSRLYLLIHYDADRTGPSADSPWSGDAAQPPWLKAGARAFGTQSAQSIFDDLKRLQKVNSRLAWTSTIGPALEQGVAAAESAASLSAEAATEVRTAIAAALSAALQAIRADQAAVKVASGRTAGAHSAPQAADLQELMTELVEAASGMEGRDPISLDIISPTIDPDAHGPQLAGSFLYHFGGFLEEEFRQSDFALGYRNAQYWLSHRLGHLLAAAVFDGAAADPAALAALQAEVTATLTGVQAAYDALGWDAIRHAGAQMKDLSAKARLELVELGGHAAHVIAHDLRIGGA